MTEVEWLGCPDPEPMLEYLRGKVSERKLLLFSCACCRRVRDRVLDEASWRVVEVMERHADGEASNQELVTIAAEAEREGRIEYDSYSHRANFAAESTASIGTDTRRCQRVIYAAALAASDFEPEQYAQASLLRCSFGNPFRPVAVDPRWLTSTVLNLARVIYEDRAFDRLPILADALEDAGCDSADLLAHLRGEGPHVRGCWAVDLVLGKS